MNLSLHSFWINREKQVLCITRKWFTDSEFRHLTHYSFVKTNDGEEREINAIDFHRLVENGTYKRYQEK